MSILSDVAVALRKDALSQLPKEILSWLEKEAEHEEIAECPNHGEDRGRLFILRNTRWDKTYEDVGKFYEELEKLPPESYRVLEACYQHPETDFMDCGGWLDNPFHLRKDHVVELNWVEL
jgi:hypothetical protein